MKTGFDRIQDRVAHAGARRGRRAWTGTEAHPHGERRSTGVGAGTIGERRGREGREGMPRCRRNADLGLLYREAGGVQSAPEEVGDAIMEFSRRGLHTPIDRWIAA
jgi:hypothetical protein